MSAGVSGIVALLVWQRRRTRGVIPFVLLMLTVTEWSLASAFQMAAFDFNAVFFWVRMRYIGIVCVSTLWLIFAQEYTEQSRGFSRRTLALLTIEPVVFLILVWTNNWHHWVWPETSAYFNGQIVVWSRTHGLVHWLHFVYSYVLMIWGTVAFVRMLFRSPRFYKAQITALLIVGLIPLLGNALSTFGGYLSPSFDLPFDLTPFAFSLSGVVIALSLYTFKFLDIVPLARSTVVEGLQDGLLVLDDQGRLVDLNPVAWQILGQPAAEVVGKPYADVLRAYPVLSVQLEGDGKASQIVVGEEDAARWYESRVVALYDKEQRLRGRMVTLHDVTEHKRAEASLEAQTRLLENLVTVARVTAEGLTLEETLRRILDVAVQMTQAEGGKLFMLNAEGAVIQYLVSGGDRLQADTGVYVRQVVELGLGGWAIRHRQAALAADTRKDERWVALPDDLTPVRSALSVPIMSEGEVLGVLTLEHAAPGHFTRQHVDFMQAAVTQMALAMRNARLFEEQRRLADQQSTLYTFIRSIGGQLNPRAVIQMAVDSMSRISNWLLVSIMLPNSEGTHLVVQAASSQEAVARGWSQPIERGVTGRAYQMQQTQVVNDVRRDRDYIEINPLARSEVAVPLCHTGEVLGVLDVESGDPDTFTPDAVRLLESMGEAISLALQNARSHAKMGRYVSDLSTLHTITHAISQSLVLDQVLAKTLASAVESMGFEAGMITLAESNGGALTLVAEQGMPRAEMMETHQRALVDALCAHVHASQRALVVQDIEQDVDLFSALGQAALQVLGALRALQMRACVMVPLIHQERSLGTIGLFSRAPLALGPEDQAIYLAVGRQVAVAVTNARLYQAVTDERRRLQALINSSRDGIVFIGMDGRILVINQRALAQLQLAEAPSTWVGRSMEEALVVLRRQTPAAARLILHRLQSESQPAALVDDADEGEYELPPHAVHWVNLPVTLEQGVVGRLLVLRDVTEERALEKMRDDLIHTMVHDLRNPLTGISGALKLLSNSIPDAALSSGQRQMFGIIRSSSERMLELVNAILDISRLESGRMPLELRPVALGRLADAALQLLLPAIAEKKQSLERDIPADLPRIVADRQLVERVLQNLVGNAVKFTPEGGQIWVSAALEDGETPCVLVSVRDTGEGIPPEIQKQLFQKFVTGRQEGSGSGLGLAFCRMVIEAHGGRIWAENTPDGGAVFCFTLFLEAE